MPEQFSPPLQTHLNMMASYILGVLQKSSKCGSLQSCMLVNHSSHHLIANAIMYQAFTGPNQGRILSFSV